VRLRVPVGTLVSVQGASIDISATLGDVVIWRRDGLPAYHLVSVIEDATMGTTHIIRGEDLRATSALQIYLAGLLGLESVVQATYIHHPLVLGPDGRKLSKSTLAGRGPR
jgi:glutamyl/glutaminyl-tRNA synthetase